MDDPNELTATSEPTLTTLTAVASDTALQESNPENPDNRARSDASVPADGSSPEDKNPTARALQTVAKEAWRLERACDRLLPKLPAMEQRRFEGHLRWFRKQLDGSLEDAGMRLVSIEGQLFEAGTAATALNIEDFSPGDELVVDKMIEPIVMTSDGDVLQMGTVTVRKARP